MVGLLGLFHLLTNLLITSGDIQLVLGGLDFQRVYPLVNDHRSLAGKSQFSIRIHASSINPGPFSSQLC